MAQRSYSPDFPYDVKGDQVRHDLLGMIDGRPARILSVGCGVCATEAGLQSAGAEVWGLDISRDAVARASKVIHRAICGDIETDPLAEIPKGYFDAILCGDVLEHLRYTELALGRIREWLTDGGQFVVSVPNAAHYSVIRELAFRRDWKYEDAGLFDRGHYRLFTRKSLVRMLEAQGYAVEALGRNRPLAPKAKKVWFLIRPMLAVAPVLDDYLVQQWIVRGRKSAPPRA